MHNQPIYHPESLGTRRVYRIGTGFYRYIGKCPYCRVDAPKWCFQPLPNQRVKTIKKLSFNQVRHQVYECEGASWHLTQKQLSPVQQTLFRELEL